MKLAPLPPKPPLLPPFWYIGALVFVLCAIALAANVACALDAAAKDATGTLALHCGLMAWLLLDLAGFAFFTSRMFRKWHELRRDWEELRRMREELERGARDE